jgi:hypothetical protein
MEIQNYEMKPLFTIHAGEYLFANEFYRKYPNYNLWIPAKDEGIDFLISDPKNEKTLSIQVKYSRDYNVLQLDDVLRTRLKTIGWFHLNRKKLQDSKADYWVLINYEGFTKATDFFFIRPNILFNVYSSLGRKGDIIDSYLWVMQDRNKAYETRGINKSEKNEILMGNCPNTYRNFSYFLNKWEVIQKSFTIT